MGTKLYISENIPKETEAFLFDLIGRCIAIHKGYGKLVMDISHLSKGTYLLKLKTNNSIRTQKIFIKN
jgi:hypothetical protein